MLVVFGKEINDIAKVSTAVRKCFPFVGENVVPMINPSAEAVAANLILPEDYRDIVKIRLPQLIAELKGEVVPEVNLLISFQEQVISVK